MHVERMKCYKHFRELILRGYCIFKVQSLFGFWRYMNVKTMSVLWTFKKADVRESLLKLYFLVQS